MEELVDIYNETDGNRADEELEGSFWTLQDYVNDYFDDQLYENWVEDYHGDMIESYYEVN